MKRFILAGIVPLLFTSMLAAAQGTVRFVTRMDGQFAAQVSNPGTQSPVNGLYVGQLFVGAPGGPLSPVGRPVPFQSGNLMGYITTGGIVAIPEFPPGSTVDVKMAAWNSAAGVTYAEVQARGLGDFGESGVFPVTLGGGDNPPALLAGLQGFEIAVLIPEPSVGWLVLVGLGVLEFFRRRKA